MELDEIAAVFNALSQKNRLMIFRIMVEHSKEGISPTEISVLMGNIPRNTLSFHLNLMYQAHLCFFEKKGKNVIYKPDCSTVKKIASLLLKDCASGECKC